METTTSVSDESVRARWHGKDAPNRRYELTLKIGADDDETLKQLFRILAERLKKGDIASNAGGSNCDGTFVVVVNAGQTPEKYKEEMDQWLAANKPATETKAV